MTKIFFRSFTFVLLSSILLVITGCSDKSTSPSPSGSTETKKLAQVYKSPTCGCCGLWVEHLEKANFETTVTDLQDLQEIKAQFDIPQELQSCHTAVIDGYVFEGHIPADIIKRFLNKKPEDAKGLAVPGMPIGSPGMEMGDKKQPYDVILLKKDGTTEVFAHVANK